MSASKKAAATTGSTPSTQLAGFVAKYDPAVGRLFRELRAAVRKRFPTANELVYDNYQFLAVGYSASERTSDCLVSLAVSPKGVAMSFFRGASLPDPSGILLGEGNQHRFLRLTGPAMLEEPAVLDLLRAAELEAPRALASSGRGKLIIKSISAKQRPRRAK